EVAQHKIAHQLGAANDTNGAASIEPASYLDGGTIEAVRRHATGNAACGTATDTGNTVPAVDVAPSFAIPAGTSFTLTASGSDSDPGQTIPYAWDQVSSSKRAGRPPLQSAGPSISPEWTVIGEQIGDTDGPLTFRSTVRDNYARGGGVSHA